MTLNNGKDNICLASRTMLCIFAIYVLFSVMVTPVNAETQALLGDVNLSGAVDFLDIGSFVLRLSSSDFQPEADIDENGSVNFLDIVPFIKILINDEVRRSSTGERHYNSVPLLGGTKDSIDALAELIESAKTDAKDFLLLGDSQETSEGFGNVFVPVLNLELSKVVGLSRTDLIATGSNRSSLTNGRFLHNSVVAGGSTVIGGTSPHGYRFYNTGASLGVGVILFANGENNNATSGQVDFDKSNLVLEIYSRKRTGGESEITTRFMDLGASEAVNFFETLVLKDVSSGLNMDADDTTWVTHTVAVPNVPGNLQIVVRGGTIGGMRLIDNNRSGGATVSSFSAGGLRADSYLLNLTDIAPYVRATGKWDATFIALGANDWQSGSPSEFKSAVQSLITDIRDWHNDPNHMIVLVGEVKQFNPPNLEFMENQASVIHAIACEEANIVALNQARQTDFFERDVHFADDIHLNGEGAKLRAELLAELLLNMN